MASITTDAAHDTATDELDRLIASWRRHLVAQRMSPATLSTYSTSGRQLARLLADRGMQTSAPAITREHVEAFTTDLLERWKPANAHNRYRALTFVLPLARRPGRDPDEPDGPHLRLRSKQRGSPVADLAGPVSGPSRGGSSPRRRRPASRQRGCE